MGAISCGIVVVDSIIVKAHSFAMSKGSITLGSPLEDCELGVQKEITVICTPKTNDAESGFTADVDEVVDYNEGEKESEDGKPYSAKDRHAPAVAIVISGGKPKK